MSICWVGSLIANIALVSVYLVGLFMYEKLEPLTNESVVGRLAPSAKD
jgi:hypothetical protein